MTSTLPLWLGLAILAALLALPCVWHFVRNRYEARHAESVRRASFMEVDASE